MRFPFSLPCLIAAILACASSLFATTYYVSPSGNNANSGLTEAAPLATPQAAINMALPGDTVYLRGGAYDNGTGTMVFGSQHRGSSSTWLTVAAYPGEQPVLRWTRATATFCAIWLTEAAYVQISGLTLVGWNDELTLTEAQADTTKSLLFNAVAIQADGRDTSSVIRTAANRPHHFRLIGNTMQKFSGGGISFIQSDYLDIEGNTVQDCCWYTVWAGSGISIWQAWNLDSSTSGYRISVIGNRLFGNKTLVNWIATGALSDGNGLIIDDSRNTQNGSTRGAYTGNFLVANNLSVNNGGSGIHSNLSDNVDIVENTTYDNGQVLNYGEIFALNSGNVRIYNNVCVASSNRAINKQDTLSTNVDYRDNLYFGGYANAAYYTANNTTADPVFISPSTDPTMANFSLGASSPAIDATLTGSNGVAYPWVSVLTTDITGGPRISGTAPDLGAYEYGGRLIPTTGLVVTGTGEPIFAGDTTTSTFNETAFPATEINLSATNAPVNTFKVANLDSVSCTISALSVVGSSAFTLVNSPTLPLVLGPGASTTFSVRFTPTTTGTQSATVTLVHSSPNTASPFAFVLSGVGVQLPYANVSVSGLATTLPAATTGTHTGLVLTNNGTAPMTWSANLPKLYTASDSMTANGPAYGWIDIASTGTAVSFKSTDDSYSPTVNMGITFPFYGASYTQLCINTNGHVSFDTSRANRSGGYNSSSPLATMTTASGGLLSRSIAVLLDNLYVVSGTSSVLYQKTDANTFVVSWLNVTYYADTISGKASNLWRYFSFQLVLRRDGTITAQYQGVALTQNAYLLGIVNTLASSLSGGATNDPNQFVQYAYSQTPISANLAVCYTPLAPTSRQATRTPGPTSPASPAAPSPSAPARSSPSFSIPPTWSRV